MTRKALQNKPTDSSCTSCKESSIQASSTSSNWNKVLELYSRDSEDLSAYLRKNYGNGPPDPEDVVQQAFERLANYGDLQSVKNLKAFLWRTARNLLLTHHRNADARSKYDYEVEHLYFASKGSENDPERVLEARQQLNVIENALRKMPQRRREAFLLHRVEGLSLTATGERLGVTRHAIIKHVTRAAVEIETAIARCAQRKIDDSTE